MNPIAPARNACNPIDRRPMYEWAAEHITLPPVMGRPGKFDITTVRHLIEPFHALQDEKTRRVVVVKPTRGQGTLLADVWCPWQPVNDPGPFLFNMNTDTVAERHAEHRLMPILEACEPFKYLLHVDRHKKRKTEIMLSNGYPVIVQGPATARLQAQSYRYIVLDEIWDKENWKPGKVEEALARLGDYDLIQNSKALIVSQAGWQGDPLDDWYQAGHQAEWQIQCSECQQYQTPKWRDFREDKSRCGIVYDGEAENMDSVGRVCETVRWECKHCGHGEKWSHRLKAQWNKTGRYQYNNLEAQTVKSFHYNALIVRTFEFLAEEWCKCSRAKAGGNFEPMRTFFQKHLAEPWNLNLLIEAKPVETIELSDRDKAMPDEKFRILTVDVQRDEVYMIVRAWDKDFNSLRLAALIGIDDETIKTVQEEFKIPAQNVFVDVGFTRQTEVLRWLAANGWMGLHGADRNGFNKFYPHKIRKRDIQQKSGYSYTIVNKSYSKPMTVDAQAGTKGQGRGVVAQKVMFINYTFQDMIQRLLDRKTTVKWQRLKLEDSEMEELWEKHLNGTKRIRKILPSGGVEESFSKNPDDHFRDCEKMQCVAVTRAGASI